MKTHFRTGDIVRCVHATDGLIAGHIYTVAGIEEASCPLDAAEGRWPYVHLKGKAGHFYPYRFTLFARADNDDGPREASRIATRMAEVMRERLATEGCCTIHDLARAGFTAAQIIEFEDEARALAGIIPAGEVA